MFHILAMDHIVLNVENMEAVLDFYINVLGLKAERLEDFRKGKVKFPSIRISPDTLIDLFPTKEPKPIESEVHYTDLNHFCLVIEKEDFQRFTEHLKKHGVNIEDGPSANWGAHGNAISVYFRDPENRLIEVRYYEKA